METKVKLGDIFILGEHRLACGSSSDLTLIKRLIKDDKISTIVSDPPYGVNVVESKSNFKQKLSCDIDIVNDHIQSDEEYKVFSVGWLEAIKPYLQDKNSVYIFNSDKMIFPLREAMLISGYKFSQLLIWIKSQAVVGRLDYLPQHELIAYGWHGKHYFRRSKDKSVLFHPKPAKSKLHATMKPIGLLRNIILNNTRLGDIVFDGFLGSGSTLIACEHLQRRCFGIEISVNHCESIIKRYYKLTGKEPVRL